MSVRSTTACDVDDATDAVGRVRRTLTTDATALWRARLAGLRA